MNDNLICIHKLVECVVSLLYAVAELFGKSEKSDTRRTGENLIVKRMGNDLAVLKDRAVRMSALGYDIASVEYSFLASGSVGCGSGKARGDKVKSLAVAVEKSLIFICNNVDRLVSICNMAGCKSYPIYDLLIRFLW